MSTDAMAGNSRGVTYRLHHQDHRGRILVGDSLTSFEDADDLADAVVLGASFAGRPTGILPVRQGARGWIAHEGGPGKDAAGIAGLPLADEYGVPAAAIATAEARLSGGDSLLTGTVSAVNETARALGVREGMPGEVAALVMLDAPLGIPHVVDGLIDESVHTMCETADGRILAVWSSSRIDGDLSRDVLVVASHGAKVMATYALRTRPRGLICNDAGFGLGRSGVEGLLILAEYGIAAAAVATDSARIGDALSTYDDGVLSTVNSVAAALGVAEGMDVPTAAELMLSASPAPRNT